MNKKNKRCFSFCVLLSIIVCIVCLHYVNHKRKIENFSFQEGKQLLNNPDRGFYIQVDSKDYERIKELNEVNLILLAFDLKEYHQGKLPNKKLSELEEALKICKKEKKSIIFRAAYGFEEEPMEPDTIEEMEIHITQIAEVLNLYKDNILVVQAGLLGAYGEWHSGKYLIEDEDVCKGFRNSILKAWEKNLDSSIFVAVRRPRFIREAYEEKILQNRLSLHNDALLASEDDMGTYKEGEREKELDWMNHFLRKSIQGGEMPICSRWTQPENAIHEFSNLHLTYLNLKYNEEVLKDWKNQYIGEETAFSYIEKKLGYRYFISNLKVNYPKYCLGNFRYKIGITLTICNTGFAPVKDQQQVYLSIVKHTKDGVKKEELIELDSKSIDTICNGEKTNLISQFYLSKHEMNQGEKLTFRIKIVKKNSTKGEGISFANNDMPYEKGYNQICTLAFKKKDMQWILFEE